MTACEKIRDDLSSYLENELTGDEKNHLEAHLAACDQCAMTAGRLRALQGRLHKMAPVTTSGTFHVVLKSRIRRELEPKVSIVDKFRLFFRNNAAPAYSLSLLSLLLLTYVSVDLYSHMNEGEERGILTQELAAPPIQEIETVPLQPDAVFTQERINYPMDLIPAPTPHGRRTNANTRRLDSFEPPARRDSRSESSFDDQLAQPATVTF
jgi:hypothetical protein